MSSRELAGLIEELVCHRGYVTVCTGSPLRKDDRIGLIVCEELISKGYDVVLCEYGLENCVTAITEKKPRGLLIIDAVLLRNDPPGTIVLASEDEILEKISLATTHNIPVSLTLRVLREKLSIGKAYVLGINVEDLGFGLEVSDKVLRAGKLLVDLLGSVFEKCRENSL